MEGTEKGAIAADVCLVCSQFLTGMWKSMNTYKECYIFTRC